VPPRGSDGTRGANLHNAELPDNLRAFYPDPDGPDSYPIVTYTWLLLYQDYGDARKAEAVRRFVRWCLTEGQPYNEELGFIRLPPQVARAGLEALDQIK
jgi:phosphate transport system substrate-binding protein